MKNKQNLVKIALFSVVLMFLFLIFFSFLTSAKEITVSNSEKADFTSIQEAVNNSASGDRILVSPGAYNETVKISVKNISILSKSKIPQDTFVKVFEIFANNVTIGGFTILENIKIRASIPYDGHNFYTVENCTIKYNQFLKDGIDARECYNATIKENTFLGKGIGSECYNCNFYDNVFFEGNIHTYGDSTRNLIYNNTFLKGGIALADSDDNKILKNRISNGIEDGNGIVLFESHDNFIDNNYISNCICGILLPFLCGDNEVTNNTLISNNEGIKIDHLSPWNTFKNNTIANNNIGVSILNSCPGTLITENRIQFNRDYGIYIAQSSTDPGFNGTNLIYNNLFNNTVNFFNNTKTMQYGDPVTSIWNITKTSGTNIAGGPYLGGNYWAKPDGTGFSETCLDLNRDGICDLPYNISENDSDYFPLVSMPKPESQPIADFNTNFTLGNPFLCVLFIYLS